MLALALAGLAVFLLTYVAYAIHRTHGVVEASLPCEPAVITNTSPIIDPAGYSLYSEAEVAASKAWEACMRESRELFASEGITTLSNSVYGPLIGLADLGAAILVFGGWTVGLSGGLRGRWLHALGILTALGLVAFSYQIRFLETIEVVSWIVD